MAEKSAKKKRKPSTYKWPANHPAFVNPAMREIVNPRTGELHVLLTGRRWNESPGCSVAFFHRPDMNVAVQRCRNRKLKNHEKCRAGGADWVTKVRANIKAGMSVKQGAFAPAYRVPCLPDAEDRKRPPRFGPPVRHCHGFDVRVDGERVATSLAPEKATALAQRLKSSTGKQVWVTKACRASEMVWRAK